MIKKVLIVDDDREMLLSVKEGLEKYDESFSVLTASDGDIAIERLKKESVSLVVTDLKMPRVNGFTVLATIMEHYPDIPVIIITAYSTPQMEQQARKGDAVGYGRTFVADKPMKVAVLPIGYADGISRKLSNRGQVVIGGVRRNIIGRVSMDYITVDVSDHPPVKLNDEAVLIGRQGGEELTAWDIARWAETIPYEVTCGISRRVPRMVVDDFY